MVVDAPYLRWVSPYKELETPSEDRGNILKLVPKVAMQQICNPVT